MASTYQRTRSNAYTVAGTSALAQPRYYDEDFYDGGRYAERSRPVEQPRYYGDENRMPGYGRRSAMRPPPPRRGQAQQGNRSAAILVALGLVLAVLACVSLTKTAAGSALQRQIAQVQKEITETRDANQALEAMLLISTDGEHIRNFAVNQLGLTRIQAGAIHTISVPDTRPMGDTPHGARQMVPAEESGLIATLAGLLRQISL